MFETKPTEEVKPGLELVMKFAKEKIDKNRKTPEERKTFGINKGRCGVLTPKFIFFSL
jgi:coenzyme F420 hydrogenase subunit beta